MLTRHRSICCIAVLALAGCEANHYELELTPDGESIQRQLTCWRTRTQNEQTSIVGFPEEEGAKIAAAYGTTAPGADSTKHKFASTFVGKMPNDIGGSSSYTHYATTLGSVSAYVERFRGNDDLNADMHRRLEAADYLSGLLIDWLESELKGEAGFDKLQQFLQNHVKNDVRNLCLYVWAFEIAASHGESVESDFIVRISQFFIERSYFTIDQLPALTRAVQEAEQDSPKRLLRILQQFLASKMGVPDNEPIPECLSFLSDEKVMEKSATEFLRHTEEYKRSIADWEKEKQSDPDAKKPEPGEPIVNHVIKAFFPGFQLERSDELAVSLAAATEPFATNGEWDAESKKVTWDAGMLETDSELTELPTMAFAFWSIPDETEQAKRFGKVVLEGESLGSYCLWYRGLSQKEAQEWDEFVAELKPGDGLTKQLAEFQFSTESASEVRNADPASTARDVILGNLVDESEPVD